MNKRFLLLISIIIFLPFGIMAQKPVTAKDTITSLSTGDLEDDFANSFEQPKKVLILEKKDVLVPKDYGKKEKRFFHEPQPIMQNENFAIIDLPEDFTGFKVEIVKVQEVPLPDDDIIFFRHGNVVEEMLDETTFAYSIGQFETELEANEFMEIFLLELYPEARVVSYEKGQRN
jgi:hypothetical protein